MLRHIWKPNEKKIPLSEQFHNLVKNNRSKRPNIQQTYTLPLTFLASYRYLIKKVTEIKLGLWGQPSPLSKMIIPET
jgi:hypothetical protein